MLPDALENPFIGKHVIITDARVVAFDGGQEMQVGAFPEVHF